eukprot:GFYU01008054.1.p1 GENE.GFYU01008054.1~~GFYU01008054.1.p1  ORF type:complete len:749 (+),score=265.01 GFYU01008054.1:130-2376(+)
MDFHEVEASDGVRFSWNVWPSSRLEATRIVVPFGAMYTPLKRIENLPNLPYEPIFCKGQNCRSVLNPYCGIDFRGKIWTCPFCFQRNQFPPHYADISETNLPAELVPAYSTIEYTLPRQATAPPIFLIVLDTCMLEEDFVDVKAALIMALTLLPENALIGLITYGSTVEVHELGYTECSKSYCFRGTKEVTAQQVQDLLGLRPQGQPRPNQAPPASRFLLPVSECEFQITTILEELTRDPWKVAPDCRPQGCPGVALSVAIGLLECTFPNCGARLMAFIGSPAVAGPGAIVDKELVESLRSHADLEKDKNKHYTKAVKYYNSLADRAVTNGHVIDLFCCSQDQVGLYEMKSVAEKTGGYVVLAEGFISDVFKQSFKQILERDESGNLKMAFNVQLEVQTSREFKVCGAIGPCASLKKKSASVGETEMGIGGTSAWQMCGADHTTTLGIYFEVVNQANNPAPQSRQNFVQFLTQYQHPNGQFRLRVTTLTHTWADPNDTQEIIAGFDQEAAAVLMARLAVFKTEVEEPFDILRWLDRMLIRLVSKFADFRKDDPSSFQLNPNFSIFPQFMFHLRRSQFLQCFNNSPDETAFYRLSILRENVTNSLVMIQPTLLAYTFQGPPFPVLLDATSIAPDRILLLDTFFQVVVFHGETIANWRKQGYQDMDGHENFRELLRAPRDDAHAIIKERFPVPRYVDCDQHGSQARFLLYKLNPSITHTSNSYNQGEVIFTDDVSLQVFMDHLKRLAVQS